MQVDTKTLIFHLKTFGLADFILIYRHLKKNSVSQLILEQLMTLVQENLELLQTLAKSRLAIIIEEKVIRTLIPILQREG